LQLECRIAFPDISIFWSYVSTPGLAALDRISGDISRHNRHLGANLQIMGAEMRAGRSTIDALASLADRLGLDEARSLAAMLRQSIELGTDVGDALRAFSDEMRDRRLLPAEDRAWSARRPLHISGYSWHCDVAGDHPADHRATLASPRTSSATAEF
jgi:tight adherence protein C